MISFFEVNGFEDFCDRPGWLAVLDLTADDADLRRCQAFYLRPSA